MPVLPNTELCPLVRTDFSDETGWQVLCREIARPVDDFRARLHFVSDLAFEGATHAQLVAAGAARGRSFLLVADREAICDPQQKVLALDILEMPGRSFRFVPSVAWRLTKTACSEDSSEYAGCWQGCCISERHESHGET
jgi:hypothetical protein